MFDRLVLDVGNLEQSLRFYTEILDFQVTGQHAWEGYRTVVLQLGAFHLLLFEQPRTNANYQLPKAGPVIGLADTQLDDRTREFERLGVDIVAPLGPSPWGERSMMIRDPDGYLVMIQEPRGERDES
ncbi:MAG: VOC family protein [Chloroflexota bacterium]